MQYCWARKLGNCSGKLTKEHLISKTLLGDKVQISGLSWCRTEYKEIGISSLSKRCLCKKHNNQLSIFDSEVREFKEIISKFYNNIQLKNKKLIYKASPIIFKINGRYLERWFCKTLINITLSNYPYVVIDYNAILPILFGDNDFSRPYGLNFAVKRGQLIKNDILEIHPLFNNKIDKKNELIGGLFKVQGFYFINSRFL